MNAKDKAREIWDKVSAWGKERIGDISLMESLELALEPKKKQAILDEERVYAESIIAAALAEQDAEIARLEAELRAAMVRSNQYAKRLVAEGYDDVTWYAVPLLPPDEPKEVKP